MHVGNWVEAAKAPTFLHRSQHTGTPIHSTIKRTLAFAPSFFTMESQAEALNHLTTDDLEGKFAMLQTSSFYDDLASFKKELSRTTKVYWWFSKIFIKCVTITHGEKDLEERREKKVCCYLAQKRN